METHGFFSIFAVDIPIPAKSHSIKRDQNNGYVAHLAKLTARPASKTVPVALPAARGTADPTITGATLRFCRLADGSSWSSVSLPAANWRGLGFPAGSKGYRYRGDGTLADPCRSVTLRGRVIKVTCKGAGASDAPAP
ncbi:MAG: hypothetical protein P8R42_28260 [Candidatus Binatia bacterium]|nr:hypothetical protein [Candidatus Binatia bacterium]